MIPERYPKKCSMSSCFEAPFLKNRVRLEIYRHGTHLTEQEIALYVDALVLDQQNQLPEEIREHVKKCFGCKVEVMEVGELVDSIALVV